MPTLHRPLRGTRAVRLEVVHALPLSQRAGDLVPVGRGGERRAIALANPGLRGLPYVAPTLWAAIQYISGRKKPRPNIGTARTPSASSSRVRVSGLSSTEIRRDAPRRLLLTPGWNFHGHHNETDQPMAWIDGLDIPQCTTPRHRILRVPVRRAAPRVDPLACPAPNGFGRIPDCDRRARCEDRLPDRGVPLGAHRRRPAREQLALEDEGFAATTELRPRGGPLH